MLTVTTELSRWIVDLDGSRIQLVEMLPAPPGHRLARILENGQPGCYLRAETDGWAACTSIERPTVGDRLRVVFHTGEGMASSPVQSIEEA